MVPTIMHGLSERLLQADSSDKSLPGPASSHHTTADTRALDIEAPSSATTATLPNSIALQRCHGQQPHLPFVIWAHQALTVQVPVLEFARHLRYQEARMTRSQVGSPGP